MTQAVQLAVHCKMLRTRSEGEYSVYHNGSPVSTGCHTFADAMMDAHLAARRNKLPIDTYVVKFGKNEVRCY